MSPLKRIGCWEIEKPELVVKLVQFIEDPLDWKFKDVLWVEIEKEAAAVMPTFKKEDFFYEEMVEGRTHRGFYSARYYTPKENRMRGLVH